MQEVTRPLQTKDWSLMHSKLPSRTQYLKKTIKVQETYMKHKGISEPQLRHVHWKHRCRDLYDSENLKFQSKVKLFCLLFFHGRSRTHPFQWHHKWRLTIKKVMKDCETLYAYTCWSKTTAWNVWEGWMSSDERFALVTGGNQASPLTKKGDPSRWFPPKSL